MSDAPIIKSYNYIVTNGYELLILDGLILETTDYSISEIVEAVVAFAFAKRFKRYYIHEYQQEFFENLLNGWHKVTELEPLEESECEINKEVYYE